MMYSVYNWTTGQYEYYRSSHGPQPGDKAAPTFRAQELGAGVQLEAALPVLPPDAVRVGSGPTARGRIAVEEATRAAALSGVLGEGLQKRPWLTVGALVGGFYLFYKLLVAGAKRL